MELFGLIISTLWIVTWIVHIFCGQYLHMYYDQHLIVRNENSQHDNTINRFKNIGMNLPLIAYTSIMQKKRDIYYLGQHGKLNGLQNAFKHYDYVYKHDIYITTTQIAHYLLVTHLYSVWYSNTNQKLSRTVEILPSYLRYNLLLSDCHVIPPNFRYGLSESTNGISKCVCFNNL